MADICLVIPASAVPKPRPRVARSGGVYYPERYEAWLGQVRDAILPEHGLSLLSDGPWWLSVTCYGGSSNRDGDNTVGGIMDALTGILWPNDSFKYLSDVHILWYPVINPRDARTEIYCGLLT